MLEHTAMSQAQAAQEVDRYISWPGQATSYMTGYSRTAPARRGAEGRRARFDRKQFHGRVLENERRPPSCLRTRIEVASQTHRDTSFTRADQPFSISAMRAISPVPPSALETDTRNRDSANTFPASKP